MGGTAFVAEFYGEPAPDNHDIHDEANNIKPRKRPRTTSASNNATKGKRRHFSWKICGQPTHKKQKPFDVSLGPQNNGIDMAGASKHLALSSSTSQGAMARYDGRGTECPYHTHILQVSPLLLCLSRISTLVNLALPVFHNFTNHQ
jgi:hypothetical protein